VFFSGSLFIRETPRSKIYTFDQKITGSFALVNKAVQAAQTFLTKVKNNYQGFEETQAANSGELFRYGSMPKSVGGAKFNGGILWNITLFLPSANRPRTDVADYYFEKLENFPLCLKVVWQG